MEGSTIVVILIAVIILLAWWIAAVESSRCPNCGKRFALETVKKEIEREEDCSKLERHDVKDKKGEVIGSTEQRIYGKKLYIKTTYRCKYCNKVCTENSVEEKY